MKPKLPKATKTTPKPATKQTAEIAKPSNVTLLAVVGTSPAILTETIWALNRGDEKCPPVIPNEVVAITTLKGQQSIKEQLQTPLPGFGGRRVWQALREDLLGPGAHQDERLTLRVVVMERPDPKTGGTVPLEDIRNRDENLVAADFILKQVRQYSDSTDRRLIASLAGGRKTMGVLLHAAFTHLGRPQDRLTHILVDEPFDGGLKPLFYYPTQPMQTLVARDGKTYQAGDAKLELADVPFAPLRVRFPDIAEIPTRFRDLVQTYLETFKRDATKPAVIELLQAPPRVVVDGLSIELESERQLTVIQFLLEANQKKWLQKDQSEATELLKAWHGHKPEPTHIRSALREAAVKLYEKQKSSPGPDWIASAMTEDIKRPLSYLRRALEKAGASWKLPPRTLCLPDFQLVAQS